MKKLSVLLLVVMVAGCAMFGPSKTSTGYTYTSSVSPESIESGKYQMIQSSMLNPFVAICFYYQGEKQRIIGAIFAYDDAVKNFSMCRYFYVEKGKLLIYDRDDAKKEWVKKDNRELGIDISQEAEIAANFDAMAKKYKQEMSL